MEILKIKIEPLGAGAVTHNMPCAICLQEKAVYLCNERYFVPCWKCQRRYTTIRTNTRFGRWLASMLNRNRRP